MSVCIHTHTHAYLYINRQAKHLVLPLSRLFYCIPIFIFANGPTAMYIKKNNKKKATHSLYAWNKTDC